MDQKFFQELVFKAFNNRKRSGGVDRQQVRSIDRNLFFFKLKLLIFRRWWQLRMKSTTIKYVQAVIEPTFRSVSLVCQFYCRTRWVNWFTSDVHISSSLKERLHTFMHTNNCLCFYALVCYFVVLEELFTSGSVNIDEYSPRLRLGEYSPMFTSPWANNY